MLYDHSLEGDRSDVDRVGMRNYFGGATVLVKEEEEEIERK